MIHDGGAVDSKSMSDYVDGHSTAIVSYDVVDFRFREASLNGVRKPSLFFERQVHSTVDKAISGTFFGNPTLVICT